MQYKQVVKCLARPFVKSRTHDWSTKKLTFLEHIENLTTLSATETCNISDLTKVFDDGSPLK